MTNTTFYDGKEWTEFNANKYYAQAGQIVIGRNGPVLNAFGGDCRVLLFYESSQKTGALIHISAADIYDKSHEPLIDALLAKARFGENSVVFLCGDLRHSDEQLVELRKNWDADMISYLKQKGLKVSRKIHQYVGKDVYLNTKNSLATIKSDRKKQFFNRYLSNSPKAQFLNLFIR